MLTIVEQLNNFSGSIYSNNLDPVDSKLLKDTKYTTSKTLVNNVVCDSLLYNEAGILVHSKTEKRPVQQFSTSSAYELNISEFVNSANLNSGKYYFTYNCYDYILGSTNGFIISQISPSRNEIKIIRDLSVQNSVVIDKITKTVDSGTKNFNDISDIKFNTVNAEYLTDQLTTVSSNSLVGIDSAGIGNINGFVFIEDSKLQSSTTQLFDVLPGVIYSSSVFNPITSQNDITYTYDPLKFRSNRNYDIVNFSIQLGLSGSINFDQGKEPYVGVSILVNNKIVQSFEQDSNLKILAVDGKLSSTLNYNYIFNDIKVDDVITIKLTSFCNSYNNLVITKNSGFKFKTTEINPSEIPINSSDFYLVKKINNRSYLKNIFIKIDDKFVRVLNLVADSTKNVYTIKLYEPLPETTPVKTICSVVEKFFSYGDTILYTITSKVVKNFNTLQPANFNVLSTVTSNSESTYKNLELLLNSNLSTLNKITSAYYKNFGEVELNVVYNDFSNFIFYSSAVTRLSAFIEKIKTLELYNSSLSQLYNVSSSTSDTNIYNILSKRSDIINSFDGFEKYLYYNDTSSSLYTNETGSIAPWPKTSNSLTWLESYNYILQTTSSINVNSYGYNLKPLTDTEVQTYLYNLYAIAVEYDKYNAYKLTNLLPKYIEQDPTNSMFIELVEMTGTYYDNIRLYIKGITNTNSLEEHVHDGLSGDLLNVVLDSKGWKLSSSKRTADLWEYVTGTNSTGSYIQSGSMPSVSYKQYSHEIWKRINNNLPLIYKSKGTKRSIEYLLNCYGIPRSVVNIHEFGVPTLNNSSSIKEQPRYIYSLNFNPELNSTCSIDWLPVLGSSITPNTIQLQFKPNEEVFIYPRTLLGLTNNSMSVVLDRDSYDSKYGNITLNVHTPAGFESASLYDVPMFAGKYTSLQVNFNTSGSDTISLNSVITNDNMVIYNNSVTKEVTSLDNVVNDYKRRTPGINESMFSSSVDYSGTFIRCDFEIYVYTINQLTGIWSIPYEYSNGNGTEDVSKVTYMFWNDSIGDYTEFNPPPYIPGVAYRMYINDRYSNTWWYIEFYSLSQFGAGIQFVLDFGLYGDLETAMNAVGIYETTAPEPIYPPLLTSLNFGTIGTYKFDGYIREIRLWECNSLPESTMLAYSNNPMSYYNMSQSSFNTLQARFPFTYNINVTGSIALKSVHPNQTINTFIDYTDLVLNINNFGTGSLVGSDITTYDIYPSVGNSTVNDNKFNIVDNTVFNNTLDTSKSNEILDVNSVQSTSTNVGIYMSPQDMINDDIINQLGFLSIDDYIGNPLYSTSSYYPDLSTIQHNYWKKYTDKHNIPAMLKVLQLYDFSFFEQAKQLLPARVTPLTGILIKQNILERNKLVLHNNTLTYENPTYTASLDTNESMNITSEYNVYNAVITMNTHMPSEYYRTNTLYSSSGWYVVSNGYEYNQSNMPAVTSSRESNTRFINYPIYSTPFSASMFLPTSSRYIPAQIQDYSLDMLGSRTSRYLGTLISSPAYNAPSPDLPNNDPVIEIIITGTTVLRNNPQTPPVNNTPIVTPTNPSMPQKVVPAVITTPNKTTPRRSISDLISGRLKKNLQ